MTQPNNIWFLHIRPDQVEESQNGYDALFADENGLPKEDTIKAICIGDSFKHELFYKKCNHKAITIRSVEHLSTESYFKIDRYILRRKVYQAREGSCIEIINEEKKEPKSIWIHYVPKSDSLIIHADVLKTTEQQSLHIAQNVFDTSTPCSFYSVDSLLQKKIDKESDRYSLLPYFVKDNLLSSASFQHSKENREGSCKKEDKLSFTTTPLANFLKEKRSKNKETIFALEGSTKNISSNAPSSPELLPTKKHSFCTLY